MSIDQYLVLIFAILNGLSYRASGENIYNDENDKKMIDSFLKLSESFMPGAANILGSIFDSPILNECEFKCPNKKKPKQNPKHKMIPNGCGSYGFTFDVELMNYSGFTECCNTHDICYDTCNSKKNDCDYEFKKCLFSKCNKIKKRLTNSKIGDICQETARVAFLAVQKLGCSAYGQSQSKSCLCNY